MSVYSQEGSEYVPAAFSCVVLLITGIRVYCREDKSTLSQVYAQSQTPCGIKLPSVSIHARDLEQEHLLLCLGRRV